MGQIFKEVYKKMVKGFSGIRIFLTAIRTKSIFYYVAAIEAGFVFS